jgi:adenylate cyclase
MADVFISHAHTTARQAQSAATALRASGYSVWIDDDLAVHRAYTHAIQEQLDAARAALVLWSPDAAQSEWVLSEANRAREARKLVQVVVGHTPLPMPFDQIQCADLVGWTGDGQHPNWRKVMASVAELVGRAASTGSAMPARPLALPSLPSIAILPFANISNDPEQDYFADGMMEEIVAALTRFKSLFVIASGSTLAFKGQVVTPQEVASRLGVRYVLEGSVRKAGERVRIAVKLIDASDGAQIWADRFDDTLADVFMLQDRVALSVAGVIEPTIQASEMRRAARRPSDSTSAYDLYLRAIDRMRPHARDAMLEALELAERAIALDPDFAQALTAAAHCYATLGFYGWTDDPAGCQRRALELFDRALKVAGDDATIIAECAGAETSRNPARARAMLDQAIALNPGAAQVWFISGVFYVLGGQPDAAIEHLGCALRLDPSSQNSANANLFLAAALFEKAQFSEALALHKELDGRHVSQWAVMAAACGHLGLTDEGRAALAQYRAATPVPVETAATNYFRRPEHQKLFLDGIALVEGVASAAGG